MLKASFREPTKAISLIEQRNVDLIFLDINLLEINGLQFFKALHYKPLVIFTTAYPQYAVESYEIDAFDYLVKPISFDRFLKSVTKAKSVLDKGIPRSEARTIFIKSGGQKHRVNVDEIIYFEKDKNYMTIHLLTKKILIRENMTNAHHVVRLL